MSWLAAWRSPTYPPADAPLAPPALDAAPFVLGRRLAGEKALPQSGRSVLLPPERLVRHVLVCGATGSGKTETAMRLAEIVAEASDAPVFYLDGTGDRPAAERFVALMESAGRRARVFPNEPFDGWRGESHELMGRLVEIVDYATEGPAAYYRDIAKACLSLACEHPDGPPSSSRELLDRLDLTRLREAHKQSGAARALTVDQVRQVRLRYEAFFSHTRGSLDGAWAWEDTDAAYLLLDSLALREETRGLASLLLEDFAHYFTRRKPRERFCLAIVDEFAALAETAGMARRLEQARGFNTALVLCPQVVAGMGSEQEQARLLGSVETVICHRVNTPEQIVALAGTRRAPELSRQTDQGAATGFGTTRIQHQYKVDPNDVRALKPGAAFAIARGRATKIQIEQAPNDRKPLRGPTAAPTTKTRPAPRAASALPY